MASSFEIFLDTTGPEISIYAPNYTMKNSMTDFEVKGSKRLAADHEFYFLDSTGGRHDVIFQYSGDSFLGWVDFSQFPEGVAVFYAQVLDTVFNPSPVISHSILIHGGAGVDVEIEDEGRDMDSGSAVRFVSVENRTRGVYEIKFDRVINSDELVRSIGVDEDG